MLFDQKTGEQVITMPHQREFDIWRQSISRAEFDRILNYINEIVNLRDNIKAQELVTPGNWSGSPFGPVYMKACLMDNKLTMMFVDMVLWYAIQARTDEWYYENVINDDSASGGKRYYRSSVQRRMQL